MRDVSRRRVLKAAGALALAAGAPLSRAAAPTVERWGVFELALDGPADGNPFVDVQLAAVFRHGGRSLRADGFYDGDGRYVVRCMPDTEGTWEYETVSTAPALHGRRGRFDVAAAGQGNHGPVHVANTFHFAYEDGTPYRQVGTTCYAWTHQSEALQELTLRTLAGSPFNKLRLCVFPKWYDYNRAEPALYPFAGKRGAWDFERFDPAFFRNLERRVAQLGALGIEADIILFHPYDKGHWGFDRMPQAVNHRYLRYVAARLAAYRNVWWSLANEYDFVEGRSEDEWDRLFQTVQAADPYGRLRSIHNAFRIYNHTKPWVTHVSLQHGNATEDAERAVIYRDAYEKPVVFDEVKYEGDLPKRWGQLSAEEMVLRFWQGTIAGSYVGHSETYLSKDNVIWWSHGGTLKGGSPARLAFLRRILEEGPADGLEPIDKWQDHPFAGRHARYYLGYFGKASPQAWPFVLFKTGLQPGMRFRADVIDTWNMTVTPVPGEFDIVRRDDYTHADRAGRSITLPGRPYMAVRIVRIA